MDKSKNGKPKYKDNQESDALTLPHSIQKDQPQSDQTDQPQSLQPQKEKPRYTKGEEIFNAVSHIVGGSFGIVALVLLVTFSALNSLAPIAIFAATIYGISLIAMYTMSSIYHFLRPNKAKKVFRILDHCGIYLTIAGTYTPVCLIALAGHWAGIVLISIVWGLSIGGIILKSVGLKNKAVRVISLISYIALGWCAVFVFPLLFDTFALGGILFMIAGGVAFTVGAIFYLFGRKKKGIHSVWHLFVLAGTILQFVSVFVYMILQ
ncbi:MAG: hemolysin III family protein [Firmicutes bacterium]|nr:hemolysin III family protein [Bacillota bacterium]